MTTLVLGGTGFIGRRRKQVQVVRGDISQFDDVMSAMVAAKPTRVVNLAYYLGSEPPPHAAFKLNVLGMDNCFEAARLSGANRVAYASSLAVSGEQKFYGDRIVTEDDFRHGHVQYAMHKIFNEWQAQDYREKHGLEITPTRPPNVPGPDKIVGSVDHVFCITDPARGKPVKFPYRDAMRCPVHVDEIAEIFARVILTDKPLHWVYNTGGLAISLGEIAEIVREYLPDAQITFDKETGGKELSGNYLIDNTRLVSEFGIQYRPYRERVLQIINDIRKEEGLPPIADR